MREFHFSTEAAVRYGLDEAVFLNSLAFWMEKNRANGRHEHDGRYWSYNTVNALVKLFPFWSRRQIERIITSCKEQGALLVGHWSDDPTDRTTWYSLSDEAFHLYFDAEMVDCISPNGEMTGPQEVKPVSTSPAPISPNGEMDSTIQGNGVHQTGKCNKDQLYTHIDPPIVPQRGRRESLSSEVREMLNSFIAGDEDLGKAMSDYLEVRRSLRCKNSKPAINALLKKLEQLSRGDRAAKIALLEQATANEYRSVWPLKSSQAPEPEKERRRYVE